MDEGEFEDLWRDC